MVHLSKEFLFSPPTRQVYTPRTADNRFRKEWGFSSKNLGRLLEWGKENVRAGGRSGVLGSTVFQIFKELEDGVGCWGTLSSKRTKLLHSWTRNRCNRPHKPWEGWTYEHSILEGGRDSPSLRNYWQLAVVGGMRCFLPLWRHLWVVHAPANSLSPVCIQATLVKLTGSYTSPTHKHTWGGIMGTERENVNWRTMTTT